jgi:hypothetical protein
MGAIAWALSGKLRRDNQQPRLFCFDLFQAVPASGGFSMFAADARQQFP